MRPSSSGLLLAILLTFLMALSPSRGAAALAHGGAGTGRLFLTIAWCPNFTSGKGALIEIDLKSGKYLPPKVFDWPEKIKGQGCVGEFDTPAFSGSRTSDTLLLDFVNQFGLLVDLDMSTGKSTEFAPSDPFFVGFETVFTTSSTSVTGLAATVTEDGFCDDGCIGIGTLHFPEGQKKTGKFEWVKNGLPYKAVIDDAHYYDEQSGVVYSQFSYPLTQEAKCGTVDSDLCLVGVSTTTGSFTTVPTNYTIYDTVAGSLDTNGEIFAFIEGFPSICKSSHGNFLYAKVNLKTGVATPVVCLAPDVVDQEGPWISSFSLDQTLWATSSGDADAGQSQLLVVDTKTGEPIYDNLLKGLPQALHAWENFIWVWAVNFVP
eukprot:TRINITY_DN5957_c0_g1_i1.p1 TRINITY_DN5957_c0_g1~~TRINITY_DN5957_c0_g1_i1.p1  ORF type:complete len:375 (+),score=80.63 TRINITY_DN5957_c0_g1_i1:260-1384(+)